MTANREPVVISWYRCPLEKADFKKLHERSDLLGWLQSLGFLAVLMTTMLTALWSSLHWPWWITLALVFAHGTVANFGINAVHELGHNTVFKTRALNVFFVRIFSFLSWINYEHFDVSHTRHHRYTLHAPDDLEVTLPIKILREHFFQYGFFNFRGPRWSVGDSIRIARGKFGGPWEDTIFPEGSPDRIAPVRWARIMLAGHLLILCFAIYFHLWLLPVLTSLTSAYGAWLHWLCNNTQHIGLQDDVPDFRLCCRTFTLNPIVQFLYWHMNYHIEHHMYAAVPCYRLGQLHRLIKADLPPCPNGLIRTWLEIAAIQKRQETEPEYQYQAPLPARGESAFEPSRAAAYGV